MLVQVVLTMVLVSTISDQAISQQRENADSPAAKLYCPDKSGYKWIDRVCCRIYTKSQTI